MVPKLWDSKLKRVTGTFNWFFANLLFYERAATISIVSYKTYKTYKHTSPIVNNIITIVNESIKTRFWCFSDCKKRRFPIVRRFIIISIVNSSFTIVKPFSNCHNFTFIIDILFSLYNYNYSFSQTSHEIIHNFEIIRTANWCRVENYSMTEEMMAHF